MAKYIAHKKKTTVGTELALKTQDPRKYCEGVGNVVNKSRIPQNANNLKWLSVYSAARCGNSSNYAKL